MKVTGPGTIHEVYRPGRSSRKAQGETTSQGPAAQVDISKDASWIESLKAELSDTPEVRRDVVEEVKAQIADGSFEESVALESVLDGLLAEL